MMCGGKLAEVTASDSVQLKTYHRCLAMMICVTPQPSCYLGHCQSCLGTTDLQERLTMLMDENIIQEITFKKWVSVDRCTLETVSVCVDDFIDSFCEKLVILLKHSFIASQQSAFQKHLKTQLQQGEFLVICDFSENYSFVMQDEAQGYHWNQTSATVHPFVAYYVEDDEEKHVSFVMISDCLRHDAVDVHLFQRKLILFLEKFLSLLPKKMYYFSDGAASQYKNRKNFINLCYHQEDFDVKAEWHFSATSHGIGACDGIGGTVKRLAARASLQRPYDEQIITPRQLLDWASENIEAIHFEFSTNEEHVAEEKSLSECFSTARPIPGTQQLHCFVPVSKSIVTTKVYSFALESKDEILSSDDNLLSFADIKGFVTCVYENAWWPDCVLATDAEKGLIKISFLRPCGPSPSFTYPALPDK